jgi:hypothetical protein
MNTSIIQIITELERVKEEYKRLKFSIGRNI